jgi:hypothetical protein
MEITNRITVKTIRIIETGRWKKINGFSNAIPKDCKSDLSIIGPRMKQIINGTIGQSNLFKKYPKTPNIRATKISNILFREVYAPTIDISKIIGANIHRVFELI